MCARMHAGIRVSVRAWVGGGLGASGSLTAQRGEGGKGASGGSGGLDYRVECVGGYL